MKERDIVAEVTGLVLKGMDPIGVIDRLSEGKGYGRLAAPGVLAGGTIGGSIGLAGMSLYGLAMELSGRGDPGLRDTLFTAPALGAIAGAGALTGAVVINHALNLRRAAKAVGKKLGVPAKAIIIKQARRLGRFLLLTVTTRADLSKELRVKYNIKTGEISL